MVSILWRQRPEIMVKFSHRLVLEIFLKIFDEKIYITFSDYFAIFNHTDSKNEKDFQDTTFSENFPFLPPFIRVIRF